MTFVIAVAKAVAPAETWDCNTGSKLAKELGDVQVDLRQSGQCRGAESQVINNDNVLSLGLSSQLQP